MIQISAPNNNDGFNSNKTKNIYMIQISARNQNSGAFHLEKEGLTIRSPVNKKRKLIF